jgi:hypothetical protein
MMMKSEEPVIITLAMMFVSVWSNIIHQPPSPSSLNT